MIRLTQRLLDDTFELLGKNSFLRSMKLVSVIIQNSLDIRIQKHIRLVIVF